MHRRLATLCLVAILPASGCEGGAQQQSASGEPDSADQTARESAPRSGRFKNGRIIADTFEVRHHLSGETLTLFLDTDLPDDTELMVGAHRLYKKRGTSDDYVIEYYSQKSDVGSWRRPREIRLDPERWRRNLDKNRRLMAAAGEPFDVGSIADEVVVSFVVPVNQDDPRFGRWNENLAGKAVERKRMGSRIIRVVNHRIVIPYPLDGEGATTRNPLDGQVAMTRWADPQALEPNKAYIVEGQTPLVPEFDPPDPLAAIEEIVLLPGGSRISVQEVRERYPSELWYRVRASSAGGQFTGSGWVNSTALIGQNIREVEL